MIEGLVFGTLIAVAVLGGEAVFTVLCTLPMIGGVASWYAGLVGPLHSGMGANLIYGGMAAQVIILPLSLVFYGLTTIRRGVAIVHKTPAVEKRTG